MNHLALLSDPDLGGGELTILRRTWTREDGVPVLTDLQELFAAGIVHPASPDTLSLFPEEYRHEPMYLIHSTEPLSLGEAGDPCWTSPDEILFRGRVFRVIQVRDWQSHGFWKAWAVRVDE